MTHWWSKQPGCHPFQVGPMPRIRHMHAAIAAHKLYADVHGLLCAQYFSIRFPCYSLTCDLNANAAWLVFQVPRRMCGGCTTIVLHTRRSTVHTGTLQCSRMPTAACMCPLLLPVRLLLVESSSLVMSCHLENESLAPICA